MKQGRTIQQVAEEIQKTAALRQDFVVPSSQLRMYPDLMLEMGGEEGKNLQPMPIFHKGMARRLDIPQRYYDRMLAEAPEMLSQNVNGWLRRSESNHFVRTLGEWGPDYHGKARAIMSDRYKAIDNDAVLGNLFPQLEQAGAVVESSEVTDTKFYLKVRFPEFEREVALNDPVQAGVVISNSEVGYGSTSVQMLIYRLVCTNGMIAASPAFRARKNHIGKQLEYDDHFNVVASSETQQLVDQAFFAQLKDMIKAATDPDVWADMVSMLSDSTSRRINGKIDDVVDRVRKVVGLQNEEASSVLDRLARDGDMSQWGLANAITRAAQDLQSYDRATELERIGGRIVELSNSEWERIAA